MSQLIDVHEPGEIIWTMGDDGNVRAFHVTEIGGLEGLTVREALRIEGER